MSVHYDFGLACDIKPTAPQQIIDTLKYMARTEDYEFSNPPRDDLFEGETWREMLRSGCSYFAGETGAVLRNTLRYIKEKKEASKYTFSFRNCILDDEMGEYVVFVEWLTQYSENTGLVGYFRSVYSDHPTLLYFRDGRVYISEIIGTPKDIRNGSPW